jgi:hypothetical protein
MLGDTVGRTPGAFGFIVSCSLEDYIASDDIILASTLVLTRNGGTELHPLSKAWKYPTGTGPATLLTDMVCRL